MVTGLEIDFGVHVRASCRDCGAEVPNALERLRGRPQAVPADSCESGMVHVDAPGACTGCGGGRIAVKATFSVE